MLRFCMLTLSYCFSRTCKSGQFICLTVRTQNAVTVFQSSRPEGCFCTFYSRDSWSTQVLIKYSVGRMLLCNIVWASSCFLLLLAAILLTNLVLFCPPFCAVLHAQPVHRLISCLLCDNNGAMLCNWILQIVSVNGTLQCTYLVLFVADSLPDVGARKSNGLLEIL